MAQTQKYLRAFGIFTAGSLVTYAKLKNDQKIQQLDEQTQTSLPVIKVTGDKPVTNIDKNYNSIIKECETRLEQWKAKQCLPGLIVGVSVKGQTVWKFASGFSDIENKIKCSDETMMRIASISKSVTSAFLMKMVEKNQLDLDKPIRAYLTKEEFPDKLWENKPVDITLRQLAAHLGGIRHYKETENESESEFLINKSYKTSVDSLEIFKNDPLGKF